MQTNISLIGDQRSTPADRLLVAELGGTSTVINDELADALLAMVQSGDASEELRAKAAISLGPVLEEADIELSGFPEDSPITEETFLKIQESFHKLYADVQVPKEVRRRILEASVRGAQDWHQNAIETGYASDDEDWKLTAVFSMIYVRGFDARILESLGSENKWIQQHAIEAVSYIRPEKADDVLIHLLDSNDDDIVEAAKEAMDMSKATSDDDEFEDW